MEIIREAINHFTYGVTHDIFKPPVMKYANLAILALEKQEPKPVNHNKGFWTYRHFCPNCSIEFQRERLKYCDNCGQHLDWSNYEKELKHVR
jgi:hypothetical protein